MKEQLENLIESLSEEFCKINSIKNSNKIYDCARDTILHGPEDGSEWDKPWIANFISNNSTLKI